MSLSFVRAGSVIAMIVVTILTFADVVAAAAPETLPPQSAALNDHPEGFSTDDVKDVFEAIQFVMISLGFGAGLYWFRFHYLPAQELPRVEFDVDIERISENDVSWIVELVALIKNRGHKKAELNELRFALESVLADGLSTQGGPLITLKALAPLYEGEWVPTTFVLDPGTRSRRAVAVAIPKTVDQVVVTAQMRNASRTEPYNASRSVRLARPPRSGFAQ